MEGDRITVTVTLPDGNTFPIGHGALNNYEILITSSGEFTVRDADNHKRLSGSRNGSTITLTSPMGRND